MATALLMILLSVTPAECKADPEWCACRRYIAKELNKCQVEANGRWMEHWKQIDLTNCLATYEKGKIACLKNDGDLYP
jgi:hypothetical protein